MKATPQEFQAFFVEVLTRLKARVPEITQAAAPQPTRTFHFGLGKTRTNLYWEFIGQTFSISVSLFHIDPQRNIEMFDAFLRDREQIEANVGTQLNWEYLPGQRKKRISVLAPHSVNDLSPSEELESLKYWIIETSIHMVNVFRPRIKEFPPYQTPKATASRGV